MRILGISAVSSACAAALRELIEGIRSDGFRKRITQTAAGQNQQETEQMRQQGIMAGLGVQRRGQDINANSEMNKLAGNPLDQKAKELRNRGIIAGLDHDAPAKIRAKFSRPSLTLDSTAT